MSDAADELILECELTPGRTWLVRDRSSDRRLVLKRLPDDCIRDGQLHPAIKLRLTRLRELPLGSFVNLVGVERHPSLGVVLVSEYVEGCPLARLTPAERQRLLRELQLALASMHQLGMVHGLVHGHNVIWNSEAGRLFLIDPSPLLHEDAAVDLRAVDRLSHPATAAQGQSGNTTREPDQDRPLRQRTLVAAVALVVLAIGAAVGIGHYLVE